MQMLNRLKTETKILAASLVVGGTLALIVAAYTYVYANNVQRDIADNVIRFHVMAHSNDDIDQALKEHVRTEILAEFASTLFYGEVHDVDAVRAIVADNLPAIQEHAQKTVRQAGFDHDVHAEISTIFFPTRLYGNMVFPPGNYEAVQIIIGDGVGSNWWCLMFPPLCYVDLTSTAAGRRQLAETVSEEGFRLLMHQEETSPELVVRFRVVEWWQNRRNPATAPQPGDYQMIQGSN